MFSSSVSANLKVMANFATTSRKCIKLSSPRCRTVNLPQLKNEHCYNDMFQTIRFDQPNFTNVLIQRRKILADTAEEESYGDVGLIKEFNVNLQKLQALMEEFRVLEMERFLDRVKGEVISVEEQEEAEVLSRDMVNEFLEKPLKYFSREDVNLEDKLADLKLLVGMLQQSSCSVENHQADVSKKNNLCLRHYLR